MTDQKTGTAQEQKLLRLVRVQTVLIALLLAALSVFVILTARSLNRMDRSLDLDTVFIHQVFLNLLVNAALFSDDAFRAKELADKLGRGLYVSVKRGLKCLKHFERVAKSGGGLAGGSGRGRAEHRSRLAGQGCGYAQGSGYQFPERDHLVAGPGH